MLINNEFIPVIQKTSQTYRTIRTKNYGNFLGFETNTLIWDKNIDQGIRYFNYSQQPWWRGTYYNNLDGKFPFLPMGGNNFIDDLGIYTINEGTNFAQREMLYQKGDEDKGLDKSICLKWQKSLSSEKITQVQDIIPTDIPLVGGVLPYGTQNDLYKDTYIDISNNTSPIKPITYSKTSTSEAISYQDMYRIENSSLLPNNAFVDNKNINIEKRFSDEYGTPAILRLLPEYITPVVTDEPQHPAQFYSSLYGRLDGDTVIFLLHKNDIVYVGNNNTLGIELADAARTLKQGTQEVPSQGTAYAAEQGAWLTLGSGNSGGAKYHANDIVVITNDISGPLAGTFKSDTYSTPAIVRQTLATDRFSSPYNATVYLKGADYLYFNYDAIREQKYSNPIAQSKALSIGSVYYIQPVGLKNKNVSTGVYTDLNNDLYHIGLFPGMQLYSYATKDKVYPQTILDYKDATRYNIVTSCSDINADFNTSEYHYLNIILDSIEKNNAQLFSGSLLGCSTLDDTIQYIYTDKANTLDTILSLDLLGKSIFNTDTDLSSNNRAIIIGYGLGSACGHVITDFNNDAINFNDNIDKINYKKYILIIKWLIDDDGVYYLNSSSDMSSVAFSPSSLTFKTYDAIDFTGEVKDENSLATIKKDFVVLEASHPVYETDSNGVLYGGLQAIYIKELNSLPSEEIPYTIPDVKTANAIESGIRPGVILNVGQDIQCSESASADIINLGISPSVTCSTRRVHSPVELITAIVDYDDLGTLSELTWKDTNRPEYDDPYGAESMIPTVLAGYTHNYQSLAKGDSWRLYSENIFMDNYIENYLDSFPDDNYYDDIFAIDIYEWLVDNNKLIPSTQRAVSSIRDFIEKISDGEISFLIEGRNELPYMTLTDDILCYQVNGTYIWPASNVGYWSNGGFNTTTSVVNPWYFGTNDPSLINEEKGGIHVFDYEPVSSWRLVNLNDDISSGGLYQGYYNSTYMNSFTGQWYDSNHSLKNTVGSSFSPYVVEHTILSSRLHEVPSIADCPENLQFVVKYDNTEEYMSMCGLKALLREKMGIAVRGDIEVWEEAIINPGLLSYKTTAKVINNLSGGLYEFGQYMDNGGTSPKFWKYPLENSRTITAYAYMNRSANYSGEVENPGWENLLENSGVGDSWETVDITLVGVGTVEGLKVTNEIPCNISEIDKYKALYDTKTLPQILEVVNYYNKHDLSPNDVEITPSTVIGGWEDWIRSADGSFESGFYQTTYLEEHLESALEVARRCALLGVSYDFYLDELDVPEHIYITPMNPNNIWKVHGLNYDVANNITTGHSNFIYPYNYLYGYYKDDSSETNESSIMNLLRRKGIKIEDEYFTSGTQQIDCIVTPIPYTFSFTYNASAVANTVARKWWTGETEIYRAVYAKYALPEVYSPFLVLDIVRGDYTSLTEYGTDVDPDFYNNIGNDVILIVKPFDNSSSSEVLNSLSHLLAKTNIDPTKPYDYLFDKFYNKDGQRRYQTLKWNLTASVGYDGPSLKQNIYRGYSSNQCRTVGLTENVYTDNNKKIVDKESETEEATIYHQKPLIIENIDGVYTDRLFNQEIAATESYKFVSIEPKLGTIIYNLNRSGNIYSEGWYYYNGSEWILASYINEPKSLGFIVDVNYRYTLDGVPENGGIFLTKTLFKGTESGVFAPNKVTIIKPTTFAIPKLRSSNTDAILEQDDSDYKYAKLLIPPTEWKNNPSYNLGDGVVVAYKENGEFGVYSTVEQTSYNFTILNEMLKYFFGGTSTYFAENGEYTVYTGLHQPEWPLPRDMELIQKSSYELELIDDMVLLVFIGTACIEIMCGKGFDINNPKKIYHRYLTEGWKTPWGSNIAKKYYTDIILGEDSNNFIQGDENRNAVLSALAPVVIENSGFDVGNISNDILENLKFYYYAKPTNIENLYSFKTAYSFDDASGSKYKSGDSSSLYVSNLASLINDQDNKSPILYSVYLEFPVVDDFNYINFKLDFSHLMHLKNENQSIADFINNKFTGSEFNVSDKGRLTLRDGGARLFDSIGLIDLRYYDSKNNKWMSTNIVEESTSQGYYKQIIAGYKSQSLDPFGIVRTALTLDGMTSTTTFEKNYNPFFDYANSTLTIETGDNGELDYSNVTIKLAVKEGFKELVKNEYIIADENTPLIYAVSLTDNYFEVKDKEIRTDKIYNKKLIWFASPPIVQHTGGTDDVIHMSQFKIDDSIFGPSDLTVAHGAALHGRYPLDILRVLKSLYLE